MKNKGFTLIELAVVIAIIAILAAVAIPRFGNTAASAECSTMKGMVGQLSSAASIYTAEQSVTPNDFSNYVKTTALAAGDAHTFSVVKIGPKGAACTVAGDTLTCNNSYNKYTGATYTWLGGTITLTSTPAAGSPACSLN